jgi:hypothetical protein
VSPHDPGVESSTALWLCIVGLLGQALFIAVYFVGAVLMFNTVRRVLNIITSLLAAIDEGRAMTFQQTWQARCVLFAPLIRSASRAGIGGLVAILLVTANALAQADPLPSWNDGTTRQAIVAFVTRVTQAGGPVSAICTIAGSSRGRQELDSVGDEPRARGGYVAKLKARLHSE